MTMRASNTLRFALLGTSVLCMSSASWAADQISCNLSGYKAQSGLTAAADGQALVVTWNGEGDQEVRLRLSVNGGTPTFEDISLRHGAGAWTSLGTNVTPDFSVTTGMRRMSNQQLQPLYGLGVKVTQDVLNQYRWDPFWDAPLDFAEPRRNPNGGSSGNPPPADGLPGTDQPGLPRKAEEVQNANAVYAVKNCAVASEGGRLTVTYPGVKLGLFDGSLQYTVFKGTNLVKQEVVASTKANWVAYKYDAGLKGLPISADSRAAWRDISSTWQSYRFGGQVNEGRVNLTAANRVVVAEGKGGSISAFPPPHKFFWAREIAINMAYNWYRKDSDTTYAIGVRQNEHEHESENPANWALYSARPNTQQLMTVFLYPSLGSAEDNAKKVLAFTHDDKYAPLPGYQVMQHHYHMDLGQRMLDAKNTATFLPDLEAIKALGVNIVSQIDSVMLDGFADNVAAENPKLPPATTKRRRDQFPITAAAVSGARQSADKGFVIMPSQEVYGSPLGGHTDLLFSHPVYWDQRFEGQPFEENNPKYGKVYHVGSAADFMKMVQAENALISMPHPRTKGSTGFPDAVKDQAFFSDPHYLGFGLRWGMGIDGSERKTCEYRCLPLIDDLANWTVDKTIPLKYAISISEVRHQQAGDDIYSSSPVTYVKLNDLPMTNDQTPIIDALKKGEMFVTTGEVLVSNFEVRGTGDKRTIVADVSYTFPLDEVEIVWGDGKKTGRQVVSTKDLPALGSHHFEIPFDAKGKKWVRFAAWDSAYEGAILQPQRLNGK